MLPKHFYDLPPQAMVDQIMGAGAASPAARQQMQAMLARGREEAPRTVADGAAVMRAVITQVINQNNISCSIALCHVYRVQGLGWGSGGRKFVLGIKSWSGGIGVSLLAQAAREPDGEMRRHIAGAIVMHPGTFDAAAISAAVGGLEV
eukprot:COSAG01_NODE_17662_length_1133_cov_1.137331_1_plen_147_part_10